MKNTNENAKKLAVMILRHPDLKVIHFVKTEDVNTEMFQQQGMEFSDCEIAEVIYDEDNSGYILKGSKEYDGLVDDKSFSKNIDYEEAEEELKPFFEKAIVVYVEGL